MIIICSLDVIFCYMIILYTCDFVQTVQSINHTIQYTIQYYTVKNSGNIGLFTALQCIKIDGGMDFRPILFQFMKM